MVREEGTLKLTHMAETVYILSESDLPRKPCNRLHELRCSAGEKNDTRERSFAEQVIY